MLSLIGSCLWLDVHMHRSVTYMSMCLRMCSCVSVAIRVLGALSLGYFFWQMQQLNSNKAVTARPSGACLANQLLYLTKESSLV